LTHLSSPSTDLPQHSSHSHERMLDAILVTDRQFRGEKFVE
jgi:hypothetical protein